MKSIKYTDILLEQLEENLHEDKYNTIINYIKNTNNINVEKLYNLAYESGINEDILLEYLANLLKKYLNDSSLDEMMTTSAASVPGGMQYYTPQAFSATHEPSDKIKKISTMFGMKPVPKTNRWFKKMDKNTGKPINESNNINLNTSLYKRMMKITKGDI